MLQNIKNKETLRLREVTDKFNISRTTLYRWILDQGFPKQIKISDSCVLYKHEIDQWLEDRASQREVVVMQIKLRNTEKISSKLESFQSKYLYIK